MSKVVYWFLIEQKLFELSLIMAICKLAWQFNLSLYSLKNFNGVKNYDLNQGNDIITYGGGPGSSLGIGKTHIRYADQRTGINNPLSSSNPKYFYKGGLVRPNSDNQTPGGGVDYNTALGASKKQGLTEEEIGINTDGNLTTLYNPDTPYSTLSKYNPTGQPLSGSDGYQIGNNLKYQTQVSDAIYYFPIEDKLVEYGRQLLSLPQFSNGTWAVTSQNRTISEYSSIPSLAIDPSSPITGSTVSNSKISELLNNSEPNSNKKGYLANLNKNLNSIDRTDDGITIVRGHNPIREGGRGIAEDFRKTKRAKRGFFDDKSTYDYIAPSGSEFTNYSNAKTLDKIYYSSADKRTSKPLNSSTDLIKFKIEIIDPTNPIETDPLTFKAYIDNFSDSYNADWKSQTYMGRAEKFYIFNEFKRTVNLTFNIPCYNKEKLINQHSKLRKLASILSGIYYWTMMIIIKSCTSHIN